VKESARAGSVRLRARTMELVSRIRFSIVFSFRVAEKI
jgi:hypothetical protein